MGQVSCGHDCRDSKLYSEKTASACLRRMYKGRLGSEESEGEGREVGPKRHGFTS
jgi:hypothetical protein